MTVPTLKIHEEETERIHDQNNRDISTATLIYYENFIYDNRDIHIEIYQGVMTLI